MYSILRQGHSIEAIEALIAAVKGMANPIYRTIEMHSKSEEL